MDKQLNIKKEQEEPKTPGAMNINNATPEGLLELAGGWTISHMAARHWSGSDSPFVLIAWVSADGKVTDVGMYHWTPGKPNYHVVAAAFPFDEPSDPLVGWCESDMHDCEGAGPWDGIVVECPNCPYWESCPRPELIRTRTREAIANGIRRIVTELEVEKRH